MKVFKFGGASVKDAEAVKNVADILTSYSNSNIVVVVSAMGKTTNAIERLTRASFYREGNAGEILTEIKAFHFDIIKKLFSDKNHKIYDEVYNTFLEIERRIEKKPKKDHDFEYDQIVSAGELLSTKIVSAWLNQAGVANKWMDVRDFLKTDSTWREAKVDWELTEKLIKAAFHKHFIPQDLQDYQNRGGTMGRRVIVTQGFIGATPDNYTTTLGREGSDYTAAIIASLLDAVEVVIWKDVPGVLNADPKWFDETQKLDAISYHEAIELSFFGAKVLHPKTIKPLQNKSIPLWVKSFYSPGEKGTLITNEKDLPAVEAATAHAIPSFIFKVNQVLISISPRDFSFIVEENLSDIFGHFAKYGIKVNMMQHSAISFSVCVDDDKSKLPQLIDKLQWDFKVLYNENLELITIRHYDQPTIDRVTKEKKILVEQRTRQTARFVVK
ncbi:MAG: aspartate kinase, partial [Bacteroidota bacterium]